MKSLYGLEKVVLSLGKMAADSGLFRLTTTLILLALLLPAASATCPVDCHCLGTIVDCSKRGLTEVPPDLPNWIEKLDLSANKRLKLKEGDFNGLPKLKTLCLKDLGLERLPPLGNLLSLETLYLSSNRIKSVADLSLTEMAKLRELDLSRNRLTTLSSPPFRKAKLRKLNLSRNYISYLDTQSFESLPYLEELKLSRNHLNASTFSRTAHIFRNLTNLRTLDLNGNKLHRLEGLVFEHLKKLKVLKLRRNEITSFSDGVFYGLNAIENLLLDYNNITTIRKGLLFGLSSLTHLSLSQNQIDSIRPDAWEPTKHLKTLDLSNNRLVSLREGTFRALGALTELTLSHNHLAHIERDAFAPTSSLLTLDLSHNQLRWSVEDNSGAFSRLERVHTLSLAYNGIETIHAETFTPLRELSSLDMRGNQIRTLPHNPFIGLNRLTSVQLNTSSLVCDYHLSWLPGWLSSLSFNNSSIIASCSYPNRLRDRPVATISSRDFARESSPRPIISQSPKDQIALRGANVTLACVAEFGSEGDQPKFMWRKNSQLLVNFQLETLVSVVGGDGEGGAKHNVTSLLHLQNVSDEDTGEYQCVVRNHFGASYSQRANMQVHVFPYFTKRPASVEVRIGDVARLECAAEGSPTPEISLVKDGIDFPAARERRIHVYNNETIFFIKPVKSDDEGQYTCIAKNAAGVASSHASLTVRETPKFTKGLKDRVARLGDNAVLECQGTGKPTPKLTWTKDGDVIKENEHYVLVKDSQYLLILDTKMDDAGTYVCELTNILGTVRGPINLSIRRDITSTSTTTGIVMMAVVGCVVITSLVWVVIIYQTRKRPQAGSLGPPPAYPREDVLGRYPAHLPTHHHLPSDLVHTFTPLLANSHETYTTAGQDSGSEHSSGKDSGTGDSAQRSNEDLLPLDLSRPGLRRSLIICADNGSASVLRGASAVSVGPNGELVGCEDALGRPRLSTFSPHLSPGSYSPNQYTASLRRGSNSRRHPVPSPTSPSASLPRGQHLCQTDDRVHPSVLTSPSPSTETCGHYSSHVVPVLMDDQEEAGSKNIDPVGESLVVNSSDSDTNNLRTVICSAGDGRSELDLRLETAEVKHNSIPKQTIESR